MKAIVLAAVVLVFFSVSCSNTVSGGSSSNSTAASNGASSSTALVTSIPTSITPATPANLCDQSSLKLKSPRRFSPSYSNQSGAYQQLKNFAELGVTVSLSIQKILSNIAVPTIYGFLVSNTGKTAVINSASGIWVYYNTNAANGTYLYYGTNAGFTNIYIDWKPTSTGFSGKAVWFDAASDTASDFSQGTFVYDTSVPNPSLDMCLQMKTGNSDDFSNFRVLLTGNTTDQSVSVAAKVDFTAVRYSGELSFITGWDMVGYAKQGTNGGVEAWTVGVTNTTNSGIGTTNGFFSTNVNGITNLNGGTDLDFLITGSQTSNYIICGSNFTYTEYFDPSGLTLYALGSAYGHITFDEVTSITNTATNLDEPINILNTNYISSVGIIPSTNYFNTNISITNSQSISSFFYVDQLTAHIDFQYTNWVDPSQALTNNTPPSDVAAILANLATNRMTSNVYPVNTLP